MNYTQHIAIGSEPSLYHVHYHALSANPRLLTGYSLKYMHNRIQQNPNNTATDEHTFHHTIVHTVHVYLIVI